MEATLLRVNLLSLDHRNSNASPTCQRGSLLCPRGLKLIWKVVLQVWKLRNQHLHPSSHEQEDHSLLEATIHHIFQEAQQDPILQDMIAHTTSEQILSKPTRQVQQWVTHSNNHIRAHRKASQLHAKLQTKDIQQFFPRIPTKPSSHTADKNLLRPP